MSGLELLICWISVNCSQLLSNEVFSKSGKFNWEAETLGNSLTVLRVDLVEMLDHPLLNLLG